jgi:pimeloyl-ACP methyl ester carboxylesterase
MAPPRGISFLTQLCPDTHARMWTFMPFGMLMACGSQSNLFSCCAEKTGISGKTSVSRHTERAVFSDTYIYSHPLHRRLQHTARREAEACEKAKGSSGRGRDSQVRFETDAASPDQPRDERLPVLLVHGLSATSECFDVAPGVSLAKFLAKRGWEVFAVDLRGAGRSDHPDFLGTPRSRHWTCDTYLREDYVAAIDTVLSATGAPRLHCVGHSLGGMLLCGALSDVVPNVRTKLASGVMLSASPFLGTSWFVTYLASLIPLATCTSLLYARMMQQLVSPFVHSIVSSTTLDRVYFWPSNTTPAAARSLHARCFSDPSAGVVEQIYAAMKGRRELHCNDAEPQ